MSQPPLDYVTAAPVPFDRDADHLRILSILHYVWGGLTLAFSSIFIVHVVLGLAIVSGHSPFPPPAAGPGRPSPPFPAEAGYLFVGFGGCAVVCGWTLGLLTIVAGRRMQRRRSRVFGMVIAAVNCVSFPLGTTLGVFTIIVLARDSVRQAYAAAAAGRAG